VQTDPETIRTFFCQELSSLRAVIELRSAENRELRAINNELVRKSDLHTGWPDEFAGKFAQNVA
jgi:hypothetical protein